jgi:hypothetical protein
MVTTSNYSAVANSHNLQLAMGSRKSSQVFYFITNIFCFRASEPSGQSSWLQIQRSGFNSWRYQIFREIVGLERGPLSLVEYNWGATWKKSSCSGLEIRDYGRKGSAALTTLHPSIRKKFALTSSTSGVRSVFYSSLADSGHGVFLFVPCSRSQLTSFVETRHQIIGCYWNGYTPWRV